MVLALGAFRVLRGLVSAAACWREGCRSGTQAGLGVCRGVQATVGERGSGGSWECR